jgi:hypothetical protein
MRRRFVSISQSAQTTGYCARELMSTGSHLLLTPRNRGVFHNFTFLIEMRLFVKLAVLAMLAVVRALRDFCISCAA